MCGIRANFVGKLRHVQNNAARIIVQVTKFDHITDILKELHLLLIAQRIKVKVLLLVFKYVCGLAPTYLSELLIPYIPSCTMQSSSSNLFTETKTILKT